MFAWKVPAACPAKTRKKRGINSKPFAVTMPPTPTPRMHDPTRALRRMLLALAVTVLGWGPASMVGQDEGRVPRSERRALKKLKKADKKALKTFEKNYKEAQKRHYKLQQTGKEKNLIMPDGDNIATNSAYQNQEKVNVRKQMRKAQQKARRQRDGRSVPWWRRIWLRRKWKKH
jgi:hypothetical protein